ncbi:MAG: beta-ketoacyl-[acyl-carrier-protein] synthase family protein [Deltaproteobacteria bacterium]|nr:beta-ketoacyl-[acyl-carrier-protein] synthase family protein [Deltaproteobacteria bacterium]
MSRRVVVAGLGVVAPNAVGVPEFEGALRAARSGVRMLPRLRDLGFGCQVAGIPDGADDHARAAFDVDELQAMNSNHRFACLAALEAWADAGLHRPRRDEDAIDWATGAVLGTGVGGMDTIAERVVPFTDAGKVRRLGSTTVEQVMASGISARVAGLLALGNQVTTNSSACCTGTEAVVQGLERIRSGRAERMLCGGSEGASHYIWAGFDAMRVLTRAFNDEPERASRPMSATAAGFVPAAGAGMLLLESLESALARGAPIRAEVLGGAANCGGHRGGGSMTAPNPEGVRRCIRAALDDARLAPGAVDAINGHLTATVADAREVWSWAAALERSPETLPSITATKSLIGHALGAAGAIESVASVLMVANGFVHATRNCEDVHPSIARFVDAIPLTLRPMPEMRVLAKASFGFGDVNACVVFGKWCAEGA